MATKIGTGDSCGETEMLKANGEAIDTLSREIKPARLSLAMWVVNLVAVVAPVVGLAVVAVSLWGRGFSSTALGSSPGTSW
jgi:hypothetical protein